MNQFRLTPGITEEDLTREAQRTAKRRAWCPEAYAESKYDMLKAWVLREAQENNWPPARLAAHLGEQLIKIAVDLLHEEITDTTNQHS